MHRVAQLVRRISPVINGIGERRIGTYAAAGTFYFFLSLPSIIIILCSGLPYTNVTQSELMSVLGGIFPDSMYELIDTVVDIVYDRASTMLPISIIFTLWSASLGMAALMRGVGAAYDSKRRGNYLIFRGKAILYMIALLLAAMISLAALVFGRDIISLLRSILGEESWIFRFSHHLRYLRYVMIFALLVVVFTALYRLTSLSGLKIRDHLPGALFSSFGWIIFSACFSLYVSITGSYSIYGVLGTIIVALLWLYYCFYILLIGGYLNNYMKAAHMQKVMESDIYEN